MKSCKRSGHLLLGLAGLGVLAGIILPAWFPDDQSSAELTLNQPQTSSSPTSRSPGEVARPHLKWASQQCLAEAEQPLNLIHATFEAARSQTPAFAAVALGFDSKLILAGDYVQGKQKHSEFLREQFEKLVISESSLLEVLNHGIEQYQHSISSVEGTLLVRLRTDVADLQQCPLIAATDPNVLHGLLQNALNRTGAAATVDLQGAVGREIISFVIGEISAQVIVHLGVSAGILGTGTASGVGTFGVGVLVGVIVDQVATAAYDAYADPKGKLVRQINQSLDSMERLIIEGTDTQPGLRDCLEQYSSRRATIRESVVLQLLQGGAI